MKNFCETEKEFKMDINQCRIIQNIAIVKVLKIIGDLKLFLFPKFVLCEIHRRKNTKAWKMKWRNKKVQIQL